MDYFVYDVANTYVKYFPDHLVTFEIFDISNFGVSENDFLYRTITGVKLF